MNSDKTLDDLLSALTEGLSDEEILLSELQSDIASEIATARIAKGLSQKELADSLGISQALVYRWESGDVNFTLQTLVRIALKLEIQIKSPFSIKRFPKYLTNGTIVDFQKVQKHASAVSPNPVWQAGSAISGGDLKEM